MGALVSLLAAVRPSQQLPGGVLVEELRLGGPDGRGPTAFISEPFVVVDRRGNIYTRGRGDSQLAVFDSAGTFLRTIGRKGSGPGEFMEASGHGFVGDTLWVTNWPSGALSMFTADGKHVMTRQVIVGLRERFATPLGITGLLGDGRAIVIPDGAQVGDGGRRLVPVLIGDREMRVADTLLTMQRPVSMVVSGVGTFWYAPVAIPPLIDLSPGGDGLVVVHWNRDRDEVDIRRLASDGSVRWTRTVALSSDAIGARVRDSIIDRAEQMASGQIEAARRRGTITPGTRTRSLVERSLDLPTRWPPVKDVVLGVDGTVWLLRGVPGSQQRWFVLDKNGAPSFEVNTALPLTIREASREVVWATFSDDDGFPYLLRYRVGPAR